MTTDAPPLQTIAQHLDAMAARFPEKPAIIASSRQESFGALLARCDGYARQLEGFGIARGTRTVLMVPPGVDFFALAYALWKLGAVPVLVDPGMGLENLGQCLAEAEPEAFVGISRAHVARCLKGWARGSLRTLVTLGPKPFWGGHQLDRKPRACAPYPAVPLAAGDAAAVLFTSGSTGVPKGACYTHGMLAHQVTRIRDQFDLGPDDVYLATFPPFAIYAAAWGMTTILPAMDFTRPAKVKPSHILGPIRQAGVTLLFGSPALLDAVGRAPEAAGLRLPSLRTVVSVGAPVPPAVLERFGRLLGPHAEIHTPYGATEAMPVTAIGSREILGETAAAWARGEGTCVGRPLAGLQLAIIPVDDGPVAEWRDDLALPVGQVGEICVTGPVVSSAYHNRPASNALGKIADPAGGVWHRMGDLGRLDEQGRVWFLGRKAHRVETAAGRLLTIPCEAIFNQHPRVFRSALVGLGKRGQQQAVLCVELEPGCDRRARAQVIRELVALGQAHPLTSGIERVLIHPAFPVDIRHNAKIFREKLAVWAEEQLR